MTSTARLSRPSLSDLLAFWSPLAVETLPVEPPISIASASFAVEAIDHAVCGAATVSHGPGSTCFPEKCAHSPCNLFGGTNSTLPLERSCPIPLFLQMKAKAPGTLLGTHVSSYDRFRVLNMDRRLTFIDLLRISTILR